MIVCEFIMHHCTDLVKLVHAQSVDAVPLSLYSLEKCCEIQQLCLEKELK